MSSAQHAWDYANLAASVDPTADADEPTPVFDAVKADLDRAAPAIYQTPATTQTSRRRWRKTS